MNVMLFEFFKHTILEFAYTYIKVSLRKRKQKKQEEEKEDITDAARNFY